MKQCEPDPQFQLALLHIIRSFSTQTASNVVLEAQTQGEAPKVLFQNEAAPAQPRQPSAEDIQIQYQAIICMKNSLTRLL